MAARKKSKKVGKKKKAVGKKTPKKRVTKKKGKSSKSSSEKDVEVRTVVLRASNQTLRHKKNIQINQEALRLKIANGMHHTKIVQTIDELIRLKQTKANTDYMSREEQAAYMCKLGTLKTILDARFKLLNKYLPDIRTIDFDDGDGNNPLVDAAREWAEALSAPGSYDGSTDS